ncbi:MAG TPA: D-alanyl-D-alanine carboxypeptidase [Ruminiclostridium sp.]|uniref:serine-type D-Ala-D-Ala carboxypeptidase n=1 Tax=Acetivibrio saccincola TaxID=1677857 RepID=A0A2K9ECL4_9FIRM|nr:D-alanyl-D-alanine carboxypeptidase family protein [Acetivibrio saccincola]AUG56955.1 D-alanyl-D-alanine carboxypeptidase DacC precursor [Acetivibrio saccincola]NLW25946.1 D-alanyl-D-alanine carboxypeptidase [Acetivibrio saccincola]PQQ66978.1 penicillin-binding protein [Acetivibrio saccincola]HAA42934.1 D-alanyl-D-alanine carboxypeptidase [Ruminiclostridium sp.]
MNNFKIFKKLSGIIILLVIVFNFHANAFAQFETAAGSAILMEASTGEILYEKNSDVPLPPASITKVMTLLIAFEAIEQGLVDWNDDVSISEKAWRMEGSKMFLQVGDKVKLGDIITGISVVSANDGCVALAEHLYGSENAFVNVMNQRAKELGMTNSTFKNSSGLPSEGHVMSAKDIAILSRFIIENYPEILELESQREFTYNNIRQFNRNPLLGVFEGADGLKTGWTEEAGYCLVGTAKQDDIRMISVVLNTKSEQERFETSQELLTYGFRNFKKADFVEAGEIIETLNVKNGTKETVSLVANDSISLVIPVSREKDIEIITSFDDETVKAPVKKGEVLGKVEVVLDDKVLASSDLSASEDVSRLGFFKILIRNIINFFKFFSK